MENQSDHQFETIPADDSKQIALTSNNAASQPNSLNLNKSNNRIVPGILRINITTEQEHEKTVQKECDVNKNKGPAWFNDILSKNITFASELPLLHAILNNILEKNTVLENWEQINEHRKKIQQIFWTLLRKHLKFCCENNLESYFWKMLYYNLLEYLRRDAEPIKQFKAIAIAEDGLRFYNNLLNKLSNIYMRDNVEETNLRKYESIARVSSQKILICLGDLSRYKAKILNLNDYSEASKYYQKAQHLIPSNGIPYNQLAILAIYTKNMFNAVYYHMRSLLSSNSISSARESLKILFDEIRKQHESGNSKNKLNVCTKLNTDKRVREEVWIYPDGIRRLNKNVDSLNIMEIHLESSSPDELMRNFTSLYLFIIGKLFSGIGLENIQKQQQKLTSILKTILRKKPLMISRHRILKIVALNIFVVQHNNKADSRKEVGYYSFMIPNQLFGFFVQKSIELISKDPVFEYKGPDFIDLNSLLQYIKIWCDWLYLNPDIWKPIRKQECQSEINPWKELKNLIECFKKLEQHNVFPLTDNPFVSLDEDLFFDGFGPIQSRLNNSVHCTKQNLAQEIEQFKTRLNRISEFSKILTHNKMMAAQPGNLALCEANGHETKSIIQGHREVETFVDNGNDKQMTQLSKLKKELESKTYVKRMYSEKLDLILKYVDTKIHLEVRPKYLLPDTNCFIDNLEEIQRLNENFKQFTLIVPLTVVKELDGLSKGIKLELQKGSKEKLSRIHHFDAVSTRAKNSLDFIKDAKNNVKCASTKGSIINSSLFGLVEELNVSNDDKILATGLALCKHMRTETNSGGDCFIKTELVLITTDRNLRVKALSRNLAVSSMNEFIHFVNGSK